MKVKKLNLETNQFSEIEISSSSLFKPDNSDYLITCPSCGKKIRLGDSFGSKEYFSKNGSFNLNVCSDCHRSEMKRFYASQGRK